ncbi:NAD-dependent epimerase/dehydratase family protein [Gorillibacterium timonense]|uniref:NAD-dependent epimerase/dehydratase family protein n=1 Tax=Gorillibacterium timonense TaxID=1689269 RepID=UPI000A646555|nr:NAD-dependent epimerase/dehydratase family protein [Gorillibacterium timonense]
MQKAIVIGAAGGTGAAITEELVNRGIPTIAFGRSSRKLEELKSRLGHPKQLTIALGDAFRQDDLIAAANEVDVFFHCANVPYHEMVNKLIPLGESVMEAADRLGSKVVAIDGIYPYGRRKMERATEEHPKEPNTRKGRIRLDYERMLFDSRWQRAAVMIVRLPDYYGPTANDASYLGSTLEAIAAGKPAFFIGNTRVPREYVYLPDAARMIIELADREAAYGQNWHIPGSGLVSGKEIIRIAQKASGSRRPVLPLGRVGLSLLGIGLPVMKEVVEMLYLTEEPFVLSGEKYERFIGPIPRTDFEEGIAATIRERMERKAKQRQV